MTFTTLVAVLPLAVGGPEIKWNAPAVFVTGQPYTVHVEIAAPKEGTVVASWLLSPAAFTVDGQGLGKREDSGALSLPSGFKIQGDVDLSAHIPKGAAQFQLGYASDLADTKALTVTLREGPPPSINFMDPIMTVEELASWHVLLLTNRGEIEVAMWPDVAPGHVRNFLDLAQVKFYDGTTFHRVMPGFMIQGGDPTGTGSGDGPRQCKAEFSPTKKHLKGVLSMARGGSPDSASCQFFIMHGTAPSLDGQYSCFGEAVSGLDVVDRIAAAPGRPIPGVGGNKPNEPQVIERAYVVKPLAK